MLEGLYRKQFQEYCVDAFVARIATIKWLTPNMLTLMGGFLGIVVACLLALGFDLFALFVMFLSGYLDIADGSLARLKQSSSTFGTVLDIIMDRVVEISIIVGLFLIAPNSRGLLCLLMMSSILLCITSFLVVGIFSENKSEKSFYYSPGLMERFETFLFFAAMILFESQFVLLSSLFCVLVLYTAVERVSQFARQSQVA